MTQPDDLERLARVIRRDFGGVDLVFANAGAAIEGSLTAMDLRDFDWLVDINLLGVFLTVRAFAPMLEEQAAAGGRPAS